MTTLECLKLFALMASPMILSVAACGVWESITYKREDKHNAK